ncbi:uncharacterized protein [Physcomitrium patens]|uniref:ApaG domain-containing protein n=1 Tax=Physcomitrium patens TaxID=3218 RepID=A0A2K1IQC6_PHYPA|nr:uncharacterized protein LOC112274388 [Physcomitrium patens]PNR31484.1 hypothetical protein PHYPA_025605 [Physcomitrium patens]|eukprot:XP_024359612.1 uncharacterized protein LOC112274388 [Physcomitrella patens]
MATLASSSLIGASNASCAMDEGFLSTSETGGSRSYAPCTCKLMGSNRFPSKASAGNDFSWLRSRRSFAWRRSHSGDASSRLRRGLGVAQSGLDDGGQIVAPGQTSTNSELSVPSSEMLLELQLQLQVATVREDYAEAARLRDMVKSLQGEDPVVRLKTLMEKAIAEEQYAEAAMHRDELNKISPPKVDLGLQCYSDTTTRGIRVRVRSVYVNDRSRPFKQQYYFAYRIRISNEALESVQLLSRHWVITDANGKVEEARGLGVIGEQPVLLPGTSFEYTSACPLRTSKGRMEGTYQMKYPADKSVATFDVKIGPFALSVNGDEGASAA